METGIKHSWTGSTLNDTAWPKQMIKIKFKVNEQEQATNSVPNTSTRVNMNSKPIRYKTGQTWKYITPTN